MSINPEYQGIYNQAKNLRYRFQDFVGTENPTAHVVHNELNQLVTDMELNKHPRDIENRVKIIQNQMYQVEHGGQNYMSYGHAQELHKDFQNMRQQIHGFGNYV